MFPMFSGSSLRRNPQINCSAPSMKTASRGTAPLPSSPHVTSMCRPLNTPTPSSNYFQPTAGSTISINGRFKVCWHHQYAPSLQDLRLSPIHVEKICYDHQVLH